MASLDSTIVNISLPSIAKSFDADISMISWVSLSYLLALAGFLLILCRLADLKGFRNVFIAGFVMFTIGSLACGLSATLNQLIAFRAMQGIGGAALDALAPAMIVLYLPEETRGRGTRGPCHGRIDRDCGRADPRRIYYGIFKLALDLLYQCPHRYRGHHRCIPTPAGGFPNSKRAPDLTMPDRCSLLRHSPR